jgi:putative addiction module CopG family antidote
MNLTLGPESERIIDQCIRTGRFRSAEDAVQAGLLRLAEDQQIEGLDAASLEAIYPGLRQKIEAGLAEARGGQLSDGEAFFDGLEQDER